MSPVNRPALPKVEVSDRSKKEPGFLDLDPTTLEEGRHYRWVRCRADEHMLAVTKTKLKGYRVEKLQKEGGVRPLGEFDTRPDGVIAVGDLVLMSCPSELYDKYVRERQARGDALMASAVAQTKEMAEEKGISLIKDADHNVG